MYAEFCQSATENHAKRAAHSYFICLKKALHYANVTDIPVIIGYMWGAFVLGQKTDGIQDSHSLHPTTSQLCEWKIESTHKKYLGIKQEKPLLFYLIPVHTGCIPHPISQFKYEHETGIFITVNNQSLINSNHVETTEIKRSKIHGYKFLFTIATHEITTIRWTIAILFSENTVYRIDSLLLPDSIKDVIAIAVQLKLECTSEPKEAYKDFFFAQNLENTVIRFVENPFSLSFKTYQDGVAEFIGNKILENKDRTIQMVTAWAKGKGITAIYETKLLGIYE
jgi:hypothetical protein